MTPERVGSKSPTRPREKPVNRGSTPGPAPSDAADPDRVSIARRKPIMLHSLYRSALIMLLAGLSAAAPVAAQVIEPNPQPFAFPVLGGADFTVDAHAEVANNLFRLGDRALLLRSMPGGSL